MKTLFQISILNLTLALTAGTTFAGGAKQDPVSLLRSGVSTSEPLQIDGAKIENISLEKATLKLISAKKASFNGSNLYNSKLISVATQTIKHPCNPNPFGGCDKNIEVRKIQADLSESRFRNANLTATGWKGINLKSASLSGSDLSRSMMVGNTYDGADFSGANLSGAIVAGFSARSSTFKAAKIRYTELSQQRDPVEITDEGYVGAGYNGIHYCRGEYFEFKKLETALNSFVGSDLSQADLTGSDLHHSDLRNTNLQSAVLYGTNLVGAYLMNANLTNASLKIAHLNNANLSGAIVTGTDFSNSILFGANLKTVQGLDATKLKGAWYDSKTQFPSTINPNDASIGMVYFETSANPQVKPIGTIFIYGAGSVECNLRELNALTFPDNGRRYPGADLTEGQTVRRAVPGLVYYRADPSNPKGPFQLQSADLRRVSWTQGTADDADFSNADLSEATLFEFTAKRAKFQGTNLRGANLTRAQFTSSNLRNADLRGAILFNTNFGKAGAVDASDIRGVQWEGAKFNGKTILPFSKDEAIQIYKMRYTSY